MKTIHTRITSIKIVSLIIVYITDDN